MNEENFKNEAQERWGGYEKRKSHGRIWAGLFLLLFGGLLLLKTLNLIFFPAWFFTWPMFLIAIGLFTGVRHGFRGGFWIILLLVGGLFLMNQIDPTLHLNRFIAPIVIIGVGLMFILRPKKCNWRRWKQDHERWKQHHESKLEQTGADSNPDKESVYDSSSGDRRDFLDVTTVFGGVKKNVLSKSFKGGDIVSFMGGSEIDLTQADFTGRVKIDATNIFGGTKLIVPPTWDVQSEVVAIFGGVDDKRQISGVNIDPNKVLILDGTCMFGGIEIRSF